MDKNALQYKDENDRSYGLAGMAISLYVWDGEEYLIGLDLDADPGDGLSVSPAFNFGGNPRVSARSVWKEMVKHLQMSTAMLLGNVMCRSYCAPGGARRLSSQTTALMRAMVRDEGRELCSLDDDEIAEIFDQTLSYLERLYANTAVATIADSLSSALRTRRSRSAAEALDFLARLR